MTDRIERSSGKIAIIGSCVTRDVWRVLNIPTDKLRTFSRTSVASLVSPAPAGLSLPNAMGALEPDGFLARCVRADVEKTALQTLELWEPEALVFDFIDERFDLLYVGNSIVCDSFEFRRSGLRARGPFIDGRPVRRLSAEVDEIWPKALDALRARIEAGPLASAKIVLHVAYWAEVYRRDGVLKSFPKRIRIHPLPRPEEGIDEHNSVLRRYHDAFKVAFPNATVVVPPEHTRIADAAHRWGLSPFHYIPDYYLSFRELCRAEGVAI
jgi:hypothetical protein